MPNLSSLRPVAAALVIVLAGPAVGSPRLAVAPVRRDAGGRVSRQLEATLCGDGRCLHGLLGGAHPDPSRARRGGATASLLGSIWRERGGRVLSLALFTTGSRPVRSWVLPLGSDGRVAPGRLMAMARELEVLLAPAAPSTGSAEPERPSAGPSPAPSHPSSPVPSLDSPPRGEASRPIVRAAAPPPVRPREPASPAVAVELGVEAARRSLRFPGGGTAPVGYDVRIPAMPSLAVELRPLGLARGRAAWLTLFAEGSWLPGIQLPSGTRAHEAVHLALRAGLRWRLPVADRWSLAPAVAWERASLVVVPVDGAGVPGLPDDRREGISATLGIEVALAGPASRPRLAAQAAGRAVRWLDARELAGGSAFFPGGRAWGVAGEVGTALRLARALTLRLVGTAEQTRWTLDEDPSGAYTVASARAVSLGGRLSLRWEP